ncbi:hypothetical protein TNCT_628581 [Trichonephila clavata]|uniref:Uncharacterized protein n=1 Tax=Trichonephila clavata TaxID=2740835 RepID=A0A8X6FSV6_TRICU|nr:hypothetical protein TNCT_628581 [Trichonephila clavata]
MLFVTTDNRFFPIKCGNQEIILCYSIIKNSGAAMKLLSLVIIFCLTSLFLGLEYPKMKGDIFRKIFQSNTSGRTRRQGDKASNSGKSQRFCSMFGCKECYVPPGALCCDGFLYDQRSDECRYVFTG